MGLALAPPGCHGVSSAFGLNAIEQPHRASRGARRHAEFGAQSVGVVALGVGGVLVEPGGLADVLGQILR
jgi:hypothetical protein